jgi:hypothetical protein
MEPDDLILLGCCGTFFLVWLVVQLLFLLAVSRALAACDARNRTLEPGMVWLNLIPIFNLAWMFVTVIRVSESLKNEFRARGLHRRDDTYAHALGIGMCLSPLAGLMPFLIVTIIYWVKIAEYTRRLENDYGYDGDGDDEDDDWDRPPRRRRGRDDDDDDRDDRPWDRGRRRS